MALLFRSGRARFQRSVRRGKKVTTEYVASGVSAALIGRLETIRLDGLDDQRWSRRQERERLDELERALDELAGAASALARDALDRAGYHQHHRGHWRRRRERPGQARACRDHADEIRGDDERLGDPGARRLGGRGQG